jgi:steroid delta-isomerase
VKRTTLERYLSACERLDPEAILACFAPDARLEDPTGAAVGTTAIRDYFARIYGPLTDLKFETTPAYWCGTCCAIHWQGRASHRNGTISHYSGIDVFVLDAQGLIRELRAFWEPAELGAW